MQDINKQLLTQTPVGMRLIALMTLYNSGNFSRLRSYVAESYHPSLLEGQAVGAIVAVLKAQRRLLGKARVREVVGSDKYEVVVLMESENDDRMSLVDMAIEEEYPHLITRFDWGVLG